MEGITRELNTRYLPDNEILKVAEGGIEFTRPGCHNYLQPNGEHVNNLLSQT
ncbi:MAG: hypothetical protein ABW158_10540 [Candidatus Thiodiazotropha sp. 6PDIVS]